MLNSLKKIIRDALRRQIRHVLYEDSGDASNRSLLESKIDRNLRLTESLHRIDLARVGPFLQYMYTSDFSYPSMPDADKKLGQRSPQEIKVLKQKLQSNLDTVWNATILEGAQALKHCMMMLNETTQDFHVLDVGCKYGISAIYTARFMKNNGIDLPVHAFDCGIAGDLVPYNLTLNDADNIEFNPFAVSSDEGYALMRFSLGHPEDNRIVNTFEDEMSRSRIVRTVTIDNFITKRLGAKPIVAKIDTQGAEPEVLAGMAESIKTVPVLAVIEFTPHALESRMAPAKLLHQLDADFFLFDCGGKTLAPLKPESYADFPKRINATESRYTDLLILSKNFKATRDIAQRLGYDALEKAA